MARAKEAGNPKFAFLFGGEPGSDAAIGFAYFQWMKMKCDLELKTNQEKEERDKSTESLQPPEPSQQLARLAIAEGTSISPAVSDTDMEDDFALLGPYNKDRKDARSSQTMEVETELAAGKISDPEETRHLSPSLTLRGMSGKEQMGINGNSFGNSHSEYQESKGVCHESAFEGPCVQDLSPVRSSPTELQHTSEGLWVEDLNPVQCPPKELQHISEGPFVEDLSPVRSLPKEFQHTSEGPFVEDLSPVRSSPKALQHTYEGPHVEDVSPVRSLPKELQHTSEAPCVEDVSPVRSSPKELQHTSEGPCVEDVSPVRSLPKELLLTSKGPCVEDVSPVPFSPKELRHTSKGPFVEYESLVQYSPKVLLDTSKGPFVEDQSLLRSSPKQLLHASEGPFVEDLSPVRSSSPKELAYASEGASVEDLTPVRSLPIELLHASEGASVEDLTPVQSLLTGVLHASEGPCIQDLSPVRSLGEELQQTSNINEQVIAEDVHMSLEDSAMEAKAEPERDPLPKDCCEVMLMDFVCEPAKPSSAQNGQSQIADLAENSSRNNLEHINLEDKEMEDIKHDLDNKSSSGAIDSSKVLDESLPLDCNANREPDHAKSGMEVLAKQEQGPMNVDEFGRLLREGASDSESDGVLYTEREVKRRGHSRSRSRSPVGNRRRKRSHSPRWRRGRRSRSRSWSPRRQRSRSRTPPVDFRYGGEAGEGRKRRGTVPQCFNFMRGRCFRGASCRFLHQEPPGDNVGRWSSGGRNRGQRENRQDISSHVTEEISAATEEDKLKIASPEKLSDGHNNLMSGEKLSEKGKNINDTSVSEEAAPALNANSDSQPHLMPLGNEDIQPPSLENKGDFRPQTLPVEDFQSQSLTMEEFQPHSMPMEEIQSQSLPKSLPGEDFQSQPLPIEGFQSQPLPIEGFQSQPLPKPLQVEGFQSQPLPIENFQSQPSPKPLPVEDFRSEPFTKPLPVEDFRSEPFTKPLPAEDLQSQPLPTEDFRSQPLPKPLPLENFHSQTLPIEDFHSQPLPKPLPVEDFRSQPLPIENFQSQPLPSEDYQSQPLPKPLSVEEFPSQMLPMEDFRSHPLPKPLSLEEFPSQMLPMEDIRSHHLPKPLLGEGFRSQPLPNSLPLGDFRSHSLPKPLPLEDFRSHPLPKPPPLEDFRSHPLPKPPPLEDFRSHQLPKPPPLEDFRSHPLPKPPPLEDFRLPTLPKTLPVDDFRSRPMHMEDFRSRPLPVEEFRSRPLPMEDFWSRSLPLESFASRPLPMENFQSRPLPLENFPSRSMPMENFQSRHMPVENFQSRPLPLENFQSQPFNREDSRRENFQSHLLPRQDFRSPPLVREDIHGRTILREGLRTEPILRHDFLGQQLLRDDSRTPSLVREEFRPPHLLREDSRSHALPRGPSEYQLDHFSSHSLVQDGLRFQHLSREDPRFRADDLHARENLGPHNFSREDLRFQQPPRDLPNVQQHGLIRHPLSSAQSLLSGNSSVLQRNPLQGNAPLLSHLNFTSTTSHSRPEYPTNLSMIGRPAHHSVIGGHPGSSSHANPFTANLNTDSRPGFLSNPTMREADFNANSFATRTTDFSHHVPFRSESTLEPFSLQHLSGSGQGSLMSRPISVPPLSPPNISRPGIQPLLRSVGTNPSAIDGEWQTYPYSHGVGGSSIGSLSALHQPSRDISAPYDPLYDSIEPIPASNESLRLFDSSKEKDNDVKEFIKSDMAPVLENVGPHDEGGKARMGTMSRPQDVEENNKHKDGATSAFKQIEADDGAEAAMDAEVGVVENGSPGLEEGKNWSPEHPLEVAIGGAGEIEIDQVRTTGKSKKTKDSRAMKLFRSALAEFVKEVLKPSWREGHMSKEAFKTIVKKAVDKVAGALQSHQIPKTQGRIDQYVASSERKLTKLVQGYIDKYVKV
eukprot:Gb_19122 [translate_table: standard]